MSDAVCPRGHLSDDPDFCSECGLRIAPPASTVPPTTPPAAAPPPQPCPDCGTPRVPGARFCEVCRHDFSSAPSPALPSAGPPLAAAAPSAAPPPPPTGAAPSPPLPVFAGAAAGNMWIVVSRDPARLDPAVPPEPDRAYPLDLVENLVGRRNGRRDLHPEVPVADPSVSARHLKVCRRPDGSLYGLDVGSSNGTLLNGAPLIEGVEAPLKVGDVLALGAWTVLKLEAR
ncbi:FHA domain-containing protein [Lichenibacterium minor]|uniref:FHA domain-containing protein n=1 Tax=Lichenibacterium minor TaxID=2316528 RepID=A0A4Q2UB98_9HYPH|nr:FHA domain-containing protein [Lichenibacterium minor]RYC33872.1 FHA domain-containing protein [Lichenibacterium minor]